MLHDRQPVRLSAEGTHSRYRAYRRVLAERISALPHVAQTSTYVAMEAVKED